MHEWPYLSHEYRDTQFLGFFDNMMHIFYNRGCDSSKILLKKQMFNHKRNVCHDALYLHIYNKQSRSRFLQLWLL